MSGPGALFDALPARLRDDPAIAEDCRSMLESADYITLRDEAGPEITCECCGTTVARLYERPIAKEVPSDHQWRPGIWEAGVIRRHTLRRCEAMQARAAPPPASP